MYCLNNSMNKIKITVLIFCCILLSCTSENEYRIITSQGIGKAKLSKSTLKKVKRAFPGGITTDSYWVVHNRGKDTIKEYPIKKSDTYIIKEEGIEFYFNGLDSLSTITVWAKNKYKTDKGIIVGQSTFRDLDSLYGEAPFRREHTNLVKLHGNLIFYANDSIVLNEGKNDLPEEYIDLKIEKIYIYE